MRIYLCADSTTPTHGSTAKQAKNQDGGSGKSPSCKTFAGKIVAILRSLYPHVKTQLRHRNPYELLMATILSAQCTDKQVNSVTPKLFETFPGPRDMAFADIADIEDLIRPTGFFHNKARHLRGCAAALLENHGGDVPNTLEELTALPGVGRKTANVVLGAAFHIPAMVVDTHVARISSRLGLTGSSRPEKIEKDLMEVIPVSDWNDFSLLLIYFGRQICTARKPDCPVCPLRDYCRFPGKRQKQD